MEKIASWVCEENVQCHKGPQRCILKKARARWFISVGLTAQLPNYPLINQKISSVLTPRFPFLSSHLSVMPFALKLTLTPSSSSSFFVFFNTHSSVYFFKILFMSNLIWEIHFEGRVLINKTPRKFVCFDGIKGKKLAD